MLVVDASAVVELLIGSPAREHVAQALTTQDALAPELLDAETIHVLARLERRGQIGPAHAIRAVQLLAEADIERVSHSGLLRGAWAHRHNLSLYDALYVSLARSLGCPLLTLDRKLATAPGIDVEVHLIRRHDRGDR